MDSAAGTAAINKMLAQELHTGCVNTFAIVDRLGGDEFVLFLPDMTREAAEESLRVLSAKLHIDYVKEKLEVMISASMGIVLSDGKDVTFQDLYEEADGCLYQVKRTFKGSYHISDKIGVVNTSSF